ncbi:FAD-dependent oxidoreductase [Natronorubrum daqingense]|uniref:NADPH-dependent 2,4-dienoyl-CoA reductase, sulfur reductase n=1 Tax=Natronorubrum daqingense TaxID=588898 RepID=A0A1N7C9I8_9EURY|nr:FAD-dependent oxidoreductase [Natronorubrum daqingense]APX98198.1 pyridine nucleotide-disulfide oxidoreductase [Natronorubrum daqingense]SIR60268.1 NADPH-dependent 2,4-dienoyl-CoA reductase, sulfur reductase [Natronorubrum daqingense]
MTETFVVVGGDAAGMSAASKAKRDDPDLAVVVFEKGEWVSYGACGLPYYVKGEIQSLESLVSVTPEEFREQRGIDLRTGHEVVSIDPDERTVTAESESKTVVQSYDHLLLATGAEPVMPDIEGTEREGVYTLGSMSDGKELREYVARARDGESFSQPDRGPACQYLEDCTGPVGIVGGGYIGLEMAEALAEHEFEVHLFQRGERVLTQFSEQTSEKVATHLREQDVVVHLESDVRELAGDDGGGGRDGNGGGGGGRDGDGNGGGGGGRDGDGNGGGDGEDGTGEVDSVVTDDESVSVDMVLVGTGVTPRTALAEAAGIECGETGAIATDAYCETNVADVYAAGDCAEATHTVTGEPAYVPLALTANRHGRAVGQTVTGTPTDGGTIAGTAAVKTFDLEAARTGILDHDDARAAGFDPVTETVDAKSRAGYYPEGGTVTVTLCADRDSGRVLGASLVSEYGEGAVHRSHAIVGALEEDATVFDLENYDLAYAPPFNTTWDPVLVAAKVLSGTLRDA